MPSKHHILIASRSRQGILAVHDLIGNSDELSIETRLIDDRQPDPLHDLGQRPDVVLFRVNGNSVRELEALVAHFGVDRPPLIVIGDAGHPECMRAAMRAGARDFLAQAVSRAELVACIARVVAESKQSKRNARAPYHRVRQRQGRIRSDVPRLQYRASLCRAVQHEDGVVGPRPAVRSVGPLPRYRAKAELTASYRGRHRLGRHRDRGVSRRSTRADLPCFRAFATVRCSSRT